MKNHHLRLLFVRAKCAFWGLLVACMLVAPSSGFVVPFITTESYNQEKQSSSVWELREVIRGEEVDKEPFDVGQGGVRLALESAIKIIGDIKHKPGSANAEGSQLMRYSKLQKVEESRVKKILKNVGSEIICTGKGKEWYKDPGDTLEKFVQLGPMEAVKDAVIEARSAMESEKLVFNFLGGDDLMLGEVLDAANELVIMLDIATKAKIYFNSMCHSSIPSGTCTVVVVSVGSAGEEIFLGVEKSIARGEVYFRDGVWYSVDEADINPAIE